MPSFTFDATVWEHDGPGAWHFVSLPRECADEIDQRTAENSTAFGSVRVEVSIGTTRWSTSLFPDRPRGTYVLPIKRSVRVAENLVDGSVAHVELTLAG
ncbi:MAG TPA: DUF1905 domain-containing protein [Jiangellaceae bacterium]